MAGARSGGARPLLAGCTATGPEKFTLATGSPGELGLLQALAEGFDKTMKGRITLQWVKAGSGESLQLLKDKKVDMIMVHAPAAEKKAVQEGWATDRTLLGSNEFFIVGPAATRPKLPQPQAPLTPTAASPGPRQVFFPGGQFRHPQKGTALWKEAGIKPAGRLVHRDQGFHDRHPETGR